MKIKTCLIAASAFCGAGSAFGADLPQQGAEPIEYVRVCDAYGAGYFQVPGKDTCLKVGSRVRVQAVSGNMMDNDDLPDYDGNEAEEYTYYTRGYLYLDSMTSTEWGMIATKVTMLYEWSEASEAEAKFDDTYLMFSGNNFSALVGRKLSLFDGFIGYTPQGVVTRNFSETYLQQANITLDFGSGVTMAMGVEDSEERGGPTDSVDFAAMAELKQGWGSMRVAGGLHSLYSNEDIDPLLADIPEVVSLNGNDDDFGYGVNATFEFNVPVTVNETKLALQATYMDSAISYLGGTGAFGDGVNLDDESILGEAFNDNLFDYMGASGWAIQAGISHELTETLTFSVDGSYAMIDADISGEFAFDGQTFDASFDAEMTRLAVDAGLAWSPAPGLVWSLSAGYSQGELEASVSSGDETESETLDFDNARIGTRIQYTF